MSTRSSQTRSLWKGWFAIGWLLTSLAICYGYRWEMHPGLRWWHGIVTHGSAATQSVALTFDDGPHPLWAPLLADTLQRHGAKGTFFVVGVQAQHFPEMIDFLLRDGHQIGNHSMTHPYPNLTAYPPDRIRREIGDAQTVLENLTHQPIRDFRPPGGGVNDRVIAAVKARHMQIAWWSYNTGDWSSPSADVTANRLARHLRPGNIILLHERGCTVEGLERFFAMGPREHYQYLTFSELTQQ